MFLESISRDFPRQRLHRPIRYCPTPETSSRPQKSEQRLTLLFCTDESVHVLRSHYYYLINPLTSWYPRNPLDTDGKLQLHIPLWVWVYSNFSFPFFSWTEGSILRLALDFWGQRETTLTFSQRYLFIMISLNPFSDSFPSSIKFENHDKRKAEITFLKNTNLLNVLQPTPRLPVQWCLSSSIRSIAHRSLLRSKFLKCRDLRKTDCWVGFGVSLWRCMFVLLLIQYLQFWA